MKSQKKKLIEHVLQNYNSENYDKNLILRSLKILSLEPEYYDLFFPNSLRDFEDLLLDYLKEKFDENCYNLNLAEMRLSERIVVLMKLSFATLSPYRELVKKISASMTLSPFRTKKILWNISDYLWKKALDESISFDYYTKRASLLLIYSKVFLFFLNDQSENAKETEEYVVRAIRGHIQITNKLKNFTLTKLPIIRFIANFRYRK